MLVNLRTALGRSRLAVVALLCSVLAGPGVWLHADADDDALCAPLATLHDVTAHRVTAPQDQSTRERHHCYICHTLRALRAPPAVRRLAVPIAESPLAQAAAPTVGGRPLQPRSSRSPPR